MLNNMHKSMLYQNSMMLNDRHSFLAAKFGNRYLQYRKAWDADINQYDIDFPLCYELQLIDSCNLRCAICHNRERTKQKIDMQKLRNILKEGECYGLASVSFGLDSEALIDKDLLCDAIFYANKYKIMDIIVATNGLLLNKEISEFLIDNNVSMLCISVDASTAETYKKIRNSNAFNKLENNIKDFLKMRNSRGNELPKVRLSFCKTSENCMEEILFYKKWSDKVDIIETQNYISTVGQLKDFSKAKKIDAHFCKDPFRRIGILANGDVQCCCCSFGHSDIIIGNINKSSIYNIWHGNKINSIRNSFRYNIKDIPNYCKTCLNNRYKF